MPVHVDLFTSKGWESDRFKNVVVNLIERGVYRM